MKKFDEFITEAQDDTEDLSTKKALVNFIASNLYRFANKPEGENQKGLLLLIAALGVLNTSDDPQALNTARRLASGALTARNRKVN
jgi:hypothetical protein